jgi:excinuclease ABC subunit A
METRLTVRKPRPHNPKTFAVVIPKNHLVVRSGSGMSTLAFDILHKEGQRQY